MRIKKGDIVEAITGKELGKRGKILRVFPKKQRAAVEGLNMIKKHTRATQQNPQGGIVEREGTIHFSNLMMVCSRCNRPVRIGTKVLETGQKVRTCHKCGEEI
jgi:large subunit ribosomal protein L24